MISGGERRVLRLRCAAGRSINTARWPLALRAPRPRAGARPSKKTEIKSGFHFRARAQHPAQPPEGVRARPSTCGSRRVVVGEVYAAAPRGGRPECDLSRRRRASALRSLVAASPRTPQRSASAIPSAKRVARLGGGSYHVRQPGSLFRRCPTAACSRPAPPGSARGILSGVAHEPATPPPAPPRPTGRARPAQRHRRCASSVHERQVAAIAATRLQRAKLIRD